MTINTLSKASLIKYGYVFTTCLDGQLQAQRQDVIHWNESEEKLLEQICYKLTEKQKADIMTKSTLSKAQSKKLISDLFYAIPDVWNTFKLMRDHLQELCITANRKGAYSSHCNFPVDDTAKFFVVKYLFDGMQAANGVTAGYDIKAILHIRIECLIAQAYAMENTEKLQPWMQAVLDSEFSTLDYCELENYLEKLENVIVPELPDTLEICELCNYKGEGEGFSLHLQVKHLPVFKSKSDSYSHFGC